MNCIKLRTNKMNQDHKMLFKSMVIMNQYSIKIVDLFTISQLFLRKRERGGLTINANVRQQTMLRDVEAAYSSYSGSRKL